MQLETHLSKIATELALAGNHLALIRQKMQIVEQAGATLVGAAVIINKSERRDIESILTMDDLQDQ